MTDALEAQLTYRAIDAFEAFHDDLSNWYVRRSRRRFYSYDDAAFRTLWYAIVAVAAHDRADHAVPHRAPLAEPRRRPLRRTRRASVFLAPWPEADERLADEALLAEIAEVRRIVELGRQARDAAGVKLRQPLRRAVVYGAARPRRTRTRSPRS